MTGDLLRPSARSDRDKPSRARRPGFPAMVTAPGFVGSSSRISSRTFTATIVAGRAG